MYASSVFTDAVRRYEIARRALGHQGAVRDSDLAEMYSLESHGAGVENLLRYYQSAEERVIARLSRGRSLNIPPQGVLRPEVEPGERVITLNSGNSRLLVQADVSGGGTFELIRRTPLNVANSGRAVLVVAARYLTTDSASPQPSDVPNPVIYAVSLLEQQIGCDEAQEWLRTYLPNWAGWRREFAALRQGGR
jgi:hypothetical protein